MAQPERYCKLLLGLVAATKENNMPLADSCYQNLITNYLNTFLQANSPRIIAAQSSDYDAQSPIRRTTSSYTSASSSRKISSRSRPASQLSHNPLILDPIHNVGSLSENASPMETPTSSSTPSPRESFTTEIRALAKLTLLALQSYLAAKKSILITKKDEDSISGAIKTLFTCFSRTNTPNFTKTKRTLTTTRKQDNYIVLFHKELRQLLGNLWLFLIKPWECNYSSLTMDTILSTYNLLIALYDEDINSIVQKRLCENFDLFKDADIDEGLENKHYPGKKFLPADDNRNTALAHFLLLSYNRCAEKIAALEEEKCTLQSRLNDDKEMLDAYENICPKKVDATLSNNSGMLGVAPSQSVEQSNQVKASSGRDKLINKLMQRKLLQEEYSVEKQRIKIQREIASLKNKIASHESEIDILSARQALLSKKEFLQKEDEEVFQMTRTCELEEEQDHPVSIDTIEDTFATKNDLLKRDVFKYLGPSPESEAFVLDYSRLSLREFTTTAFENFSTDFVKNRRSPYELSLSSNSETESFSDPFPFLAALIVLFYSIYKRDSRVFSEAITSLYPYKNDLESLSCYEINLWLCLVRVGIIKLRRSTDNSDAKEMESLLTKKVTLFQGEDNQKATVLLKEINGVNTSGSATQTLFDVDKIFSTVKSNYDKEWDTFQKEENSSSLAEVSIYVKNLSDNNKRLFALWLAFRCLYQPNDSADQSIAQFKILLTFENKKTSYPLLYPSLCKLPSLFLPTISMAKSLVDSSQGKDTQPFNSERGTSSTTSNAKDKNKLSAERKAFSQTFEDPYESTPFHPQEQRAPSFDNSP